MNSSINKDRIKLWVEALRSGEYTQGDGRLRDSGSKYCCLGVACEVSGLGVWKGGDLEYYAVNDDVEGAYLPASVRKWYGLHAENPRVELNGERIELSVVNDDYGANFNTIADAIEKTYL